MNTIVRRAIDRVAGAVDHAPGLQVCLAHPKGLLDVVSIRMAKTDLRARPVFHNQRDSIEAHLTIMFAALAISRHLQEATGVSITRQDLRLLRTVQINVGDHTITAAPQITDATRDILDQLTPINAPGH